MDVVVQQRNKILWKILAKTLGRSITAASTSSERLCMNAMKQTILPQFSQNTFKST